MKVISIFKNEPLAYQASNFIKVLKQDYPKDIFERVTLDFVGMKKQSYFRSHLDLELKTKLIKIDLLLTNMANDDKFFKRFIKTFIIAKTTTTKEVKK